MGLRVVGAGVGRTGTHSLKIALEQLLGEPCYHMLEVFGHADHIPIWHAAARGELPQWDAFLTGFGAVVDWPAAAFWKELSAANPDAVVLLSVRDDAEAWWRSADATIFQVVGRPPPDEPIFRAQLAMIQDLLANRFDPKWREHDAATAAYERHNDLVRSTVPANRLVEWRAGDGWEPICSALGLPVPSEPFPHVNTTAEFRAMTGLDAP